MAKVRVALGKDFDGGYFLIAQEIGELAQTPTEDEGHRRLKTRASGDQAGRPWKSLNLGIGFEGCSGGAGRVAKPSFTWAAVWNWMKAGG